VSRPDANHTRSWGIVAGVEPPQSHRLVIRKRRPSHLAWDRNPHGGAGDATVGDSRRARRHCPEVIQALPLAAVKHVYRIRVGTRSPVVLPFRSTETFCEILARYHEPGRGEVALVTHFEHSYEITPEARDAAQRVRRLGISVYRFPSLRVPPVGEEHPPGASPRTENDRRTSTQPASRMVRRERRSVNPRQDPHGLEPASGLEPLTC